MEAIKYKGDATNQEACDRQKAHNAKLAVAAMSFPSHLNRDNLSNEIREYDASEFDVDYMRVKPDMSVEHYGTAEEWYFTALRKMKSVSCPTFEDRANEA